jgi:hypothetical protein
MSHLGKTDKDYNRLWRTKYLFSMLSDICAKFYNPYEFTAVIEVNLKAIYDMTGCSYSMRIYLGKDRQNATQMMTVTHVILKNLTKSGKG